MSDSPQNPSWLAAIRAIAAESQISFPPFIEGGMGIATCFAPNQNRFVTFKRRLSPVSESFNDGVEWGLWLKEDDRPALVIHFREPRIASSARVEAVVYLLQGWLIEGWSIDKIKQEACARVTLRELPPPQSRHDRQEYWFSSDRLIGIVVTGGAWKISYRGQSLCVWQNKTSAGRGDRLAPASLDRLCLWLAHHWYVIAYGKDVRPTEVRKRGVAASRVYEAMQRFAIKDKQSVDAWLGRHSVRATDSELPNLFFERQGDDLVLSWDATPTPTRYYSIPAGEVVLSAVFAVPILRQMLRDRLKEMSLKPAEKERLLSVISESAESAYEALALFKPGVGKAWLASVGFTEEDAREFSVAGLSSHPVASLLRTSQDSPISTVDYEKVLHLLKPSTSRSYQALRSIAAGISVPMDIRAPWESGYLLAALVCEKLSGSPSDMLDIEGIIQSLDVEVHDLALDDTMILGACVGNPAHAPLIVVNQSCPDAIGPSGRRITLAHELCHLLFDRSRMVNLARFEGAGADSDRVVEMRANAFAVELLAPMSTLIGETGSWPTEVELKRISVERQVSYKALSEHAENMKSRLAEY